MVVEEEVGEVEWGKGPLLQKGAPPKDPLLPDPQLQTLCLLGRQGSPATRVGVLGGGVGGRVVGLLGDGTRGEGLVGEAWVGQRR